MSVEQMNEFHVVRRILRALAPEYRLLASNNIQPGESVLDVTQKTIEVGETQDTFQAVSSLLFQIGHLMLKSNPEFGLLFGKGIREYPGNPDELIFQLASLGTRADVAAMAWASKIFESYWPLRHERIQSLLAQHVWGHEEWQEYFSAA